MSNRKASCNSSYKRIADPCKLGLSPKGEALSQLFPNGHYYPEARCFVLNSKKEEVDAEHYIAVVTAGTSDVPVAEEAAVTAETFGTRSTGSMT